MAIMDPFSYHYHTQQHAQPPAMPPQTLAQRAARWNSYCEQAVQQMNHLFKGYEKEIRSYQGKFKKAIATNVKIPMMWFTDNCKKYAHYAEHLNTPEGFHVMIMNGQIGMLNSSTLRQRWQALDTPTKEQIRKHFLVLYLIANGQL